LLHVSLDNASDPYEAERTGPTAFEIRGFLADLAREAAFSADWLPGPGS
jgi:hypothetical protein